MPPRPVGRYSADPGPPSSLQSGSGRQVVVDVTIFSNNIRDIMSFTIYASQLEHFSRNPVGVQKF